MNRYKISFNDLIKQVQDIIIRKNDGLNHQQIDDEILAFISVYKFGVPKYKEYAKQYLTKFFVNSGLVKSKRGIIYE